MDKGLGVRARVSNECCPGDEATGKLFFAFLFRWGALVGAINLRVRWKAALYQFRVSYAAAQQ